MITSLPWRLGVLTVNFLLAAKCAGTEPVSAPAIALHQIRASSDQRKINITLAVFNAADFQLSVIDNATIEGASKFKSLAAAMETCGASAGCNGGFFERQPFAPVGLMISDRKKSGRFAPDGWMKGLLVVRSGIPTLEEAVSFKETSAITDLLQSGPWLVRNGQPESDANQAQAKRTFICHDAAGKWAIGSSERCTLHELAVALKDAEVAAVIDIQMALNLDGGPSTGLWLKQSPDNFYLPERWAVRNFIGIVPRTIP